MQAQLVGQGFGEEPGELSCVEEVDVLDGLQLDQGSNETSSNVKEGGWK